jgi:hypothetical protein
MGVMRMFDIERVKNVVIEFTVPFAFDVLNSSKQDHKGKPYLVVINGIPAQLRFERIYNENSTIENFTIAPFSKIESDRRGFISKSKIQVWFDKQMIESLSIEPSLLRIQPGQFYAHAIKYVNKFICDYRMITDTYWMREISSCELMGYLYALIDQDGNESKCWLPIGSHEVHFNGGNEYELSTEQEDKLRQYLLNDINNLSRELYFGILDNYERMEYNIALIQCATLFEFFVYSELRKRFSNTKMDKMTKKDCGCHIGIQQVCEVGLKEHVNFDFGATEEFVLLKQHVISVRNKIVHGTRLEMITISECEAAIDATMKAINLFRERIAKISEPETV